MEALRELGDSYWYTVFAWWRRSGVANAEAATVACFTHWLTDARPQAGDRGAGRFRGWIESRLNDAAEPGVVGSGGEETAVC